MIPVYLELQAFGPYVDVQSIDFCRLSEAGLFLIHGSTGSGKTAILDAISYCLYGKSSGGQRGELSSMRCQLAGDDKPTYIDFEFDVRGRRYKFSRGLKVRRKKRGGVDYLSWQSVSYVSEDGIYVPFFENPRLKDVEDKAEELIGLNHKQFRQVIILPQGQFEELLTASSADKESILVTLFDAERWQAASELICRQAAESGRKIDMVKSGIEHMLRAEGASSLTELKDRLSELKLSRAAEDLQRREAEAAFDRLKQTTELKAQINELFVEADRVFSEMVVLDERQDSMASLMLRVDSCKRACSMKHVHDSLDAAYRHLESKKGELEKFRSDWEKYVAAAAKACDELNMLKGEAEVMNGLRTELVILREAKPVYRLLDDAARRAADSLKQYEEARRASEAAMKDSEAVRMKYDRSTAERDRLYDEYKARLPELKGVVERLKLTSEKNAELERLRRQLKKGEAKLRDALDMLSGLKVSEAHVSSEHDKCLSAYLMNAAYAVSLSLKEGDACPVCGSIHHPRMADQPEGAADAADVQRSGDRLEDIRRRIVGQQADVAGLEASVSSLKERIQSLTDDISALTGAECFDEMALSIASDELTSAQRRSEEADRLSETIKELSADAKLMLEAATESRRQAEELYALTQSARAEYDALKGRLLEGIESGSALSDRERELSEKTGSYDVRVEKATALKAKADMAASSCEASVAMLESECERLAKEFEESKTAYRELLRVNGFSDTKELRSALSDEPRLTEYEAQINDYTIRRESLKLNLEKLKAQTSGKERPDMEAERAKLAELSEALDDVKKRATLAEAECGRISRIIAEAESAECGIRKLREEHDEMLAFGTALRGDKGISLRRYVLGVMLSNVVSEANRLLNKVHDGRYRLCMTAESSGRLRKSGLELEVFDAYSGDKRNVSGLSGGEKFLVAMSLSLGLSAVVQAQSGGIRIDTMFIDEGFGSLDSSSIGDALGVLNSVIGSGRMVGIISHVQLLKESIETAVEVTKDRKGSSISVHM